MAVLEELSEAVHGVAARVGPAVVGLGRGWGRGSGVVTEWGDPSELDLGTVVLALANPGGRGLRTTLGFVSATGRSFRGPRGRRIRGSIEHTAPLPRGSSGGPLVDTDGRLLGLNSVRREGGLILAVPADERLARRVEALAA